MTRLYPQADYTLQVAQPVFTPDGGVCSSAPEVTIACATTGADIHYTTDGSEPSTSSSAYSTPVSVSDGITLRAKAFKTGWSDSAEKSGTYKVIPYNNAVVTAVFPDFFYIETEDRSRGIRVDKVDHGLSVGAQVDVTGTEGTNADGERYIEASSVTQVGGDGEINPIAIGNHAIGGGPSGYQPGIADGSGWNNTGMLVKAWGNVTYVNVAGGYFYIDDGSALSDGSGYVGVKVLPPAGYDLHSLTEGTHLIVTGISSCFENDQVRRLIRARAQDDIVVVSDPGESFTFTLYQHSNSFSLPLSPFNPDPAAVFGGTSLIHYALTRFDLTSNTYLVYDFPGQNFGNMLLGDAYWLSIWSGGTRTFTYHGFPDGLRVDGVMSDICINLPGVAGQQGGTHYIGHPFSHNVEWAKCFVTDGIRTIPVWDNNPATDDAVQLGWLDMYWQYQDNQANTTRHIDPSGVQGSQNLEPGRVYQVITHKSNLALIVSVVDTTPPDPPVVADDGDYTNVTTQLNATWTASDPESGIKEYQYAAGRTPTPLSNPSDLVVQWTSAGRDTSASPGSLSLEERGTYYFYVKAKNGNMLWSNVGSSDGISIDTVAPTSGTASVESSSNVSPITVTYTGASDDFSGINKVELWYKKGSTCQPALNIDPPSASNIDPPLWVIFG